MDNKVSFRTMNSGYLDKDIFVLNPINQFLIKKYPKEQNGKLLIDCWKACFIAQYLLGDGIDIDKVVMSIAPQELYFLPNPRISSCFDKWLEMFKNDNVSKSEYIILDSIPGSPEPLSIEFEGIPEDTKIAFGNGLARITNEAKINHG